MKKITNYVQSNIIRQQIEGFFVVVVLILVSSRLDSTLEINNFSFIHNGFAPIKNSERSESWSMNWFKPDGLMKFTISVSRGTLFVLSFAQSIISDELRFTLNAFLFYAIMIS